MTPTITDQIGAMSIVDKLRFESHRVQDYMNTAEQKARLIEKIAAGYRKEGADVSPAVIEEGVDQWYQNRLLFKESELPWYLAAYISRERWLKAVIFSAVILLSLVGAAVGFSSVHHGLQLDQRTKGIENSLDIVSKYKPIEIANDPNVISSIATQEGIQYPFVTEALSAYAQNSIEIQSLTAQIHQEANNRKTDIANSTVPSLDLLESLTDEFVRLLKANHHLQSQVGAFIQLVNEFRHLKNDVNTSVYEQLKAQVSSIDSMLLKPGLTLREAEAAITSMKNKTTIAQQVNEIKIEVATLTERSLKQLTLDADKTTVNTIAMRIGIAIQNLTLPEQSDVDQLQIIEKLSRTELRFIINPDNSRKNGVERQYSGSGGKAWYVIVQPLDEAQAPVKLKIKSAETGKERFTDVFGVRVSKERYDQLKQDKQDDGVINERLVGTKPIGKLDFELEPGFSSEYILEW